MFDSVEHDWGASVSVWEMPRWRETLSVAQSASHAAIADARSASASRRSRKGKWKIAQLRTSRPDVQEVIDRAIAELGVNDAYKMILKVLKEAKKP
jgi:hypothetical protein